MIVTQDQAEAVVASLEERSAGCTVQERREVQALRTRVDDHEPLTPWEYRDYQELLESIG